MKLLLDTHALLWWLDDNPELSHEARTAIASADNIVFVSSASVWEIAVKRAIGKLDITDNWFEFISRDAFEELPITWQEAKKAGLLPPIHKDPFDRMLVAQALSSGLVLVTRDEEIPKYGVPILRA